MQTSFFFIITCKNLWVGVRVGVRVRVGYIVDVGLGVRVGGYVLDGFSVLVGGSVADGVMDGVKVGVPYSVIENTKMDHFSSATQVTQVSLIIDHL